MSVEVYHTPLLRRHYASYLSLTYLFFLFTSSILIILPFFLAYNTTTNNGTSGFWYKSGTYEEDVESVFKFKNVCVLYGYDVGNDHSFVYHYSTITALNNINSETLLTPTMKTLTTPLSTELEYIFPTKQGELINSVDCKIFFETTLKSKAKLVFESLAYVSSSSSIPSNYNTRDSGAASTILPSGGKVSIYGTYDIVLKNPVNPTGGYRNLYTDTDELLFDEDSVYNTQSSNTDVMLEKYYDRNVAMMFNEVYNTWSPPTQPTLITPTTPTTPFKLTIKLSSNTQTIKYTPTAIEVLSLAWIKYLAFFVVVYYVEEKVCGVVYYHQIVQSRTLVDGGNGNGVGGSSGGGGAFKSF